MRKITKILMLVLVFCMFNSCSKNEDIVDCFGDSGSTELKYYYNGINKTIITYSIEYSGNHRITSVKWTFGDGTTETINSARGTVSHDYITDGTYEVKADVNISDGSSSCTVSHTKSVTVN